MFQLCKTNLSGLLLAALTAGVFTASAVVAQTASTPAKSPAHKSPSGTATKPVHATSSKNSSKKRTKKVKGQAAPTPERITEIQGALARRGVFVDAPSGKWDDSTVAAIQKFQSANGLNPSGKLDARTLEKLGLGSETAGMAPPTAPPNSANRLRNLSSLPPDPSN
jgi:peptidoglycan hydrolase-like protein with peptidoglycan-binding domain